MIINTYLKYNEIKDIVSACKNMEDFLDRKFIKDMYLIKFTTDIKITDETSNEDYDKYISDGTIDEIYKTVKNISILDNAIKDSLSIENSVIRAEKSLEGFLDNIGKSLDKVTDSLPKSSKGWDNLFNRLSKKINKENLFDKMTDVFKGTSNESEGVEDDAD